MLEPRAMKVRRDGPAVAGVEGGGGAFGAGNVAVGVDSSSRRLTTFTDGTPKGRAEGLRIVRCTS